MIIKRMLLKLGFHGKRHIVKLDMEHKRTCEILESIGE